MKDYVPPKRWYLLASPHGLTTQKTDIDIFTAVRTSNLNNNVDHLRETGFEEGRWMGQAQNCLQ
jgi:hypothetical protein